MMQSEDDLAIQCAVDQAPHDMIATQVEVVSSSLYKKTNVTGEDLVVHGVRWYIELELENLNDESRANALYRVWCNESGEFRAVRVELW
ncbi:MAG: hypothetical protein ACRDHW_00490 [Ktedonobacteraceae bacterium]